MMQPTAVIASLANLVRGRDAQRPRPLVEWDALVRVGRAANLLGSIAASIAAADAWNAVPEGPRAHLDGALKLALRQAVAVRWEASRIHESLKSLPERTVLLKGAAYLAEGFEFAAGRMFSDVDILVPDTQIDHVEQVLARHGWATTHLSPYDQVYYRRWMHEIPPMRHLERGTVIDVHHRILPRTARYDPDPARMLAAARPSRKWPDIWVLSREDMVLHSATHLFHEGEVHNGFRDLLDIDRLVGQFSGEAGFWSALTARGSELGLSVPLRHVLQQAERLLGTAIPVAARSALGLDRRAMRLNWLYGHGLRPLHPSCDRRGAVSARWLLYARAHAMRMPPHLLAHHLGRKFWRRAFDLDDGEETQ